MSGLSFVWRDFCVSEFFIWRDFCMSGILYGGIFVSRDYFLYGGDFYMLGFLYVGIFCVSGIFVSREFCMSGILYGGNLSQLLQPINLSPFDPKDNPSTNPSLPP